MKKIIVSLVLVTVILLSAFSTVFADEEIFVDDIQRDSNKIRNKWDFVGTFTSLGIPYLWEGVPGGSTWTYEIHIKEAMHSPYSKGVILFESGDTFITAHVADIKMDYAHWSNRTPNIAAVGWVEYNGEVYNFMFLYCADAIWIALSNLSYVSYWEAGTVFPLTSRLYQIHSTVVSGQFDIEPKSIR